MVGVGELRNAPKERMCVFTERGAVQVDVFAIWAGPVITSEEK